MLLIICRNHEVAQWVLKMHHFQRLVSLATFPALGSCLTASKSRWLFVLSQNNGC